MLRFHLISKTICANPAFLNSFSSSTLKKPQQTNGHKFISPLKKQTTSKMPSFESMGLLNEITRVLQTQEITTPTPIQQLSMPAQLKHHNVLFTSQNGTGKTLSYLLPLLNKLKSEEIITKTRLTQPHRPRALILVPNRELVIQLNTIANLFVYELPLRIHGLSGARVRHVRENEVLQQGVDVLIANVDAFFRMRDRKNLFLTRVGTLVVDEFDALIDAGYANSLKLLVRQVKDRKEPPKSQFVFTSATYTKGMQDFVKEEFADDRNFKVLIEGGTHMNLTNLKHEFIHLADYDKFKPLIMLANEIKKHLKRNKSSAIVFCNSINSVRATQHTLTQSGFNCTALHGDIPPLQRKENFLSFKAQKHQFLICTDLASRGLDFPFVDHVINLDFPNTTSDYLHRSGRAGRAGKKGTVFTFYRNKNMDLINELKSSYENMQPVKIKGSSYSLIPKIPSDAQNLSDINKKVSLPYSERKTGYDFKKSGLKGVEKRDKSWRRESSLQKLNTKKAGLKDIKLHGFKKKKGEYGEKRERIKQEKKAKYLLRARSRNENVRQKNRRID